MKASSFVWTAVLATAWAAKGADAIQFSYDQGFAGGGIIPDGNEAGWTDSRQVTGLGAAIESVSISLDISGGFNGDLFAFLSHGGVMIPLLNRPGMGITTPTSSPFGYGDAGFNIVLSSSASRDVHWYQQSVDPAGGQLTGLWQADGRIVDPLSEPEGFDTSAGRLSLDAYSGTDGNGNWTLFIADLSTGGGSARVNSWSLEITPVPEPAAPLLALLGSVLTIVARRSSRGAKALG
jgi:hypothetical protein